MGYGDSSYGEAEYGSGGGSPSALIGVVEVTGFIARAPIYTDIAIVEVEGFRVYYPPTNDDFANAIELVGNSGSLTGQSNIDATDEPGEPAFVEGNASLTGAVWYYWTPTQYGPATVDTEGTTSPTDTIIEVWEGSTLVGLSYVASDDDAGTDYLSSVSWSAASGTTYYIRVTGYDVTDRGDDIHLNWVLTPTPVTADADLGVVEVTGFGAPIRLTAQIGWVQVRGLNASPAPPSGGDGSGGGPGGLALVAEETSSYITASVWERDLTTPAPPVFVCELPNSFERSYRRQISDVGTGQVSVQMDDPVRSELTEGRIVRFYRNGDHETGTLEFAFVIGAQERALVAPGEEHDEICTVAGPGVLALLGEAIVVPDRTLDIASNSNVKRYDHSSNAYDLEQGIGGSQYAINILEDHTWVPIGWEIEDGFPPIGLGDGNLEGIWTGWVNVFEDETWTEAGGWDVADGFPPLPPQVGNGGTRPVNILEDGSWIPIGWDIEADGFIEDQIDAGLFNGWVFVHEDQRWEPVGGWTVAHDGFLPLIPAVVPGINGEWGLAVVTPQTYRDVDGVKHENFGAPTPWRDQRNGKWIWSIDSNGVIPAGDCYFYNKFVLAENMLVGIEVAYDDIGWIAIDNEIIDGLVQEEFYTGQGRSVQIPLKAGTHIIAGKVTNLNLAKAGLKLAAYEVIDGALGTLLFESDDTWKAQGYPPFPPGFPPGEIMREEFASGYLRGCFLDVFAMFEDDTDSDEQPFSITSDVTLPIGADLLEVIAQLAVTYIDADMTPELGLKIWNKDTMGSPSGLELTIGQDIVEYHVTSEAGKRINAFLVRYEGGYLMVEDADLIAQSARAEGFLDLGAIRSIQEATRIARAEITERNTKKWTISTSVDIPFEDRPGLGDTITGLDYDGNPVTLRVVALTVVSGDDIDDDTWTPELVIVESAP